jgi:hypothetical protein
MPVPAPLADVEALSDWIGEPIVEDVDIKRAELALRMASALVRRESGRNWLDDAGLVLATTPDDVTVVTLTVAGRGYTNPQGWETEAVDDWQGRRDLDEVGMYLTISEKSLLSRFAGKQHRGLGTVATTRGVFDDDRETWVINGPFTYLDNEDDLP